MVGPVRPPTGRCLGPTERWRHVHIRPAQTRRASLTRKPASPRPSRWPQAPSYVLQRTLTCTNRSADSRLSCLHRSPPTPPRLRRRRSGLGCLHRRNGTPTQSPPPAPPPPFPTGAWTRTRREGGGKGEGGKAGSRSESSPPAPT